jgi:long-chain acyl-CoA synthetase
MRSCRIASGGGWFGVNIANWLERAGKASPEAPAVGLGTAVYQTYGVLADRAARLAGALRERLKLEPGARVVLVTANCPEYLEILFGIWRAGLAAVPVNAKLHPSEIAYIIDHSESVLCFAGDSLTSALGSHLVDCSAEVIPIGGPEYEALFAARPLDVQRASADSLAWLFYTSGTTGRPKGAMLTHRNLAAMSLAYLSDVDRVSPGDQILHAAPMSHGSGLYSMAHVARYGVSVVPESGGFDATEIFNLAAHWARVSMFAAPTMVKRLVEHPDDFDPSRFRTLVYGGGPMYLADAKKALERFGARLAQIYGQGESPMTITVLPRHVIADRRHPSWEARLASVGTANSAVEVRVADDECRALSPGESGEVIVRGDTVMAGYWRDPSGTETTLRDGWLWTGDLGSFDEEGFLTLMDRSKDLIISGGSNIYPREIEEVLLTHPAVREASVIGRLDPEWGEVPVAFVVGDAEACDLDGLCLSRIARFKRPKHYRFVEGLPKNNYGKVLKTVLREWDAGNPSASGKIKESES